MTLGYRTLLPLALAIAVIGPVPDGLAASKERAVNACEEAIKKEFGTSPVEFGSFRRKGRRNFAFGELTMSDGSKAQIRCKFKAGRVQSLQFRGTNEPGNMWINQRPAAAIFVEEKKDKPDGEAEKKSEADETTKVEKKSGRTRFKKVPTQ